MNAYSCNICGAEFAEFLEHGVPPRKGQCPECGGKNRHRLLVLSLAHILADPAAWTTNAAEARPLRILDIGPSKVMTKRIRNLPMLANAEYTAIDIRRLRHHEAIASPHRFLEMDACRLAFADHAFDLVFCNHVLPWVPDYRRALQEIARVLAPGGAGILDTEIDLARAETRPTAECMRAEPERFTPDYVAENGPEWVFGRAFLTELADLGLRPYFLSPQKKLAESTQKRQGILGPRTLLAVAKQGTTLRLGSRLEAIGKTL